VRKKCLITCDALRSNIDQLLTRYSIEGKIEYIDSALHVVVHRLNKAVESALDEQSALGNEAVLGFGRCCNIVDEWAEQHEAPYTKVENCYHLFLGDAYYDLLKEEPGTYFLTNYLARNFKELVIHPLKIDEYPQLKDMLFKHYKRLLFIDTDNTGITEAAEEVSAYLELPLVYRKADLSYFEEIMLTLGIFTESQKNSLRSV